MFSPNYGFEPRTRVQMVHEAWNSFRRLTKSEISFEEFQGSNVHLICNIFFKEIEEVEALFLELLEKQFQFWSEKNLALRGSFGSSFEGWQNRFKDLCASLDLLSSDDERVKKLSPAPKPGEIVIYFDDLKINSEDFEKNFEDAFRDCKNIAEPTVHGSQTVLVKYSNGETRSYLYNNLKSTEYTKLDVEIIIKSASNESQYKDELIEKELRNKFAIVNKINRPFYAQTYINITEFPGITSIELKTKLKNESDWKTGDRGIELGQKFVIDEVNITRLS